VRRSNNAIELCQMVLLKYSIEGIGD